MKRFDPQGRRAWRLEAARRGGLAAALGVLLALATLGDLAAPAAAQEPVDWEMVNRIRHEGLERSQVMEIARTLADDIGSRLTGSPGLRRANEWTRDKLAEWGLADARLEPWGPFGRGWSFSRSEVRLVAPRSLPLLALPEAWTPGTEGLVSGPVRRVSLEDEADLEEWRGKLRGQILLLSEPRQPEETPGPAVRRYDLVGLDELREVPLDDRRSRFRERFRRLWSFARLRNRFLEEEGVLATVEISSRDAGIVRVTGGGSRELDESVGVPALVMAAEHYNLVARLAEAGEVRLEIDVDARFHEDDLMAYNTLADLPAAEPERRRRDRRSRTEPGLVMVGAHLDSWHAASGANDNAAGVAVAMEAVRILKALDVEPRRTIRVALWTGEEQGLLGARAHVREHFARRPEPRDPEVLALPRALWPETGPLELLPGHERLSAYFNLDNGSGRIRGVYTQSNAAVQPIFEQWLRPFADLGATTVTNRDTGGTDHQAFDAVGLPGFQFIQDALDYSTRTHHTHLDHLDHTREEDLRQAAVVMASFLYHAAMREEPLPRNPLPRPAAQEEDGATEERRTPAR